MRLILETIGAGKAVYFLLTSMKRHSHAYRETVHLKTKKAVVQLVKYRVIEKDGRDLKPL
jgi:hypothetical protein